MVEKAKGIQKESLLRLTCCRKLHSPIQLTNRHREVAFGPAFSVPHESAPQKGSTGVSHKQADP